MLTSKPQKIMSLEAIVMLSIMQGIITIFGTISYISYFSPVLSKNLMCVDFFFFSASVASFGRLHVPLRGLINFFFLHLHVPYTFTGIICHVHSILTEHFCKQVFTFRLHTYLTCMYTQQTCNIYPLLTTYMYSCYYRC